MKNSAKNYRDKRAIPTFASTKQGKNASRLIGSEAFLPFYVQHDRTLPAPFALRAWLAVAVANLLPNKADEELVSGAWPQGSSFVSLVLGIFFSEKFYSK
jgi:hypothetical protein